MTKEFCDKCGKELDKATNIHFEFLSPYEIRFNYKGVLCPECAEEVKKFIQGEFKPTFKCGEWVEDGCLYKCSECGHTEPYYDMTYCPVCGAKNG